MAEEKLADLEAKCLTAGIDVRATRVPIRGKTFTRLDFIKALEERSLNILKENDLLTPGVDWIHKNIPESPMLAVSQTQIPEAQFEHALNSESTYAELKQDGCRALVYISNSGIEIFGRHRSVQNELYTCYTDQILGLTNAEALPYLQNLQGPIVLDCEVYSIERSILGVTQSETQLQAMTQILSILQPESHRIQKEYNYPVRFSAFDCLMWRGQNMMNAPLLNRIRALDEALNFLYTLPLPAFRWFNTLPRAFGKRENKIALFKKVTEKNGEGVVVKFLDAEYWPWSNRGSNTRPFLKEGSVGWFHAARCLKMKRSVSQDLGHELDVFIIDGERGTAGTKYENLISRLHVGVHLTPTYEVHKIATISDLTDEQCALITDKSDPLNPKLKPGFKGQVIPIECMDFSKNGLAVHARRYHGEWIRNDKQESDCTLAEAWLNSKIL